MRLRFKSPSHHTSFASNGASSKALRAARFATSIEFPSRRLRAKRIEPPLYTWTLSFPFGSVNVLIKTLVISLGWLVEKLSSPPRDNAIAYTLASLIRSNRYVKKMLIVELRRHSFKISKCCCAASCRKRTNKICSVLLKIRKGRFECSK